MTRLNLVIRNLRHHFWLHLAVALTVAVATAALTGALVVGDSVRHSLKSLALERLGPIDLLLINERFFSESLSDKVQQSVGAEGGAVRVQSACLVPSVTIEVQNQGRRSSGVFLSAWRDIGLNLQRNEIAINERLASELKVGLGDSLVIRLPEINEVPADSPLGKKDGRVQSRAGLKIIQILPMSGLGQLSLARNQSPVANAFVDLQTLQSALGVGSRVNALVATDTGGNITEHGDLARRLDSALGQSMTLADYGIRLERVEAKYEQDQVAWSAWQFTTDRMIFADAAHEALCDATKEWEQSEFLTYLANSIRVEAKPDREIPYSTVTAISPSHMRKLECSHGDIESLNDDEIVLNQWAADDLEANLGDTISVSFFDPETTHGNAVERTSTFKLRAIVALTEPASAFERKRSATFDEPPTYANDPALTPVVEGVTDQDSIDDWDPPFPFDQSRVRDQDDEYWEYYRTTPKAFVSISAGRQMWGSRFGNSTGIRLEVTDQVAQDYVEPAAKTALAKRNEDLGFVFRTIKAETLTAAAGTTPFEALFIGFNFFLIAAALMLIAILVRLAVQMRSRDLGLLQATGWTSQRTQSQLLSEVALVAILGSAFGAALGVGCSSLILAALRTWWVRAITTPFVEQFVTPKALVTGMIASFALAMSVAWWTLRRMSKIEATSLLRGATETPDASLNVKRWPNIVAILLMVVAIAASFVGLSAEGMVQSGAFFGAGALLLVGLLLLVRHRLFGRRQHAAIGSLASLVTQAAARSPGRSALTVGLVASAVFLVVAIAAFRLAPTESGTGGFEILGASDRPLFVDLNDGDVAQSELSDWPAGAEVVALRVRAGDDASCRNLYRVSQPQILGVTPEFAEHFDGDGPSFEWASIGKLADGTTPTNPWRLLDAPSNQRDMAEPVPVILDKNTAMYSLHLKAKIGEEFTVEYESPVRFRIVGLVFNTILQGNLITSEAHLEQLFPEVAGYQMLLVDLADAADHDAAKTALEQRFGDEGLDAKSTSGLLSDLLAVQNTYLSTFQSLGALGLFLGTIGVALVQLRSVLERSGEFALMQTMGFSQDRIGCVVLLETLYLVALGLAVGLVAALLAILPHLLQGAASIPWVAGAGLLVLIAISAVAGSYFAVRAARMVPVLRTVRREF